MTPMSAAIIDTFKMIKDPPSRAQIDQKAPSNAAPVQADQKEKTLPQSMTPASDAVIDTFKFIHDPPSRAQTGKGKKLPQSGSIISDAVLDGLKAAASTMGKDRNP